ncbi:MAG: response regulator [Inhella sp.]|uniref:hybrid sensor histidine kinase/response regulator n=1 Tax=Inhella sp. TaxID=1921806 RepID=UPI0022C34FC7|nr:response regulator [Inhella sp.]MCZ8234549.1 response regulator [Inhella sp.]
MNPPPQRATSAPVWRVLHVEDSELDHLMIQALLAQAGVSVLWRRVDTLPEVLQALSEPWDAIVCDYQLPGTSGLEVLRALRAARASIPFLLVSGEIGEETAVEAMREGAADYLLKTHLKRLAPALQQAIRAAQAQQARDQAHEALRESQRQLQALTRHLQAHIEAERAAMARELHDDVGSALTALKFDLAWLARHGQPSQAARAEQAMATLDVAIAASRRLMLNLRPPILQEGLVPALHWLIGQFERQQEGIQAQLVSDADIPLDEERALVAYRFVQEALHNVAKHARATRVTVELAWAGGVLTVEVRDDGVGMNVAALPPTAGLGLRGLRERAASVGAWLDLSSAPGAGTRLLLSLPVLAAGNDTEIDMDAEWLEEAR